MVGILATPVALGLGVFLRRYRGADRTAMALGVLVGAGICLIAALAWFQRRFGGTDMDRQTLRWTGFQCGLIAGGCAGGIGIVLLAVRWAIDQLGGPVGEQFWPAFCVRCWRSGGRPCRGLPAYLAAGIVLGGALGLVLPRRVAACARGVPSEAPREE